MGDVSERPAGGDAPAKNGTGLADMPRNSGNRIADATPRLRIVFAPGMRIGPGKIALIEAVGETGSIAGAGRALGMSYRRAWLLVDQVNRLFRQPVVIAAAGGAQGGGAQLTGFGRDLIAAYRRVELRSATAIHEAFAPFAADLVEDYEDQPR